MVDGGEMRADLLRYCCQVANWRVALQTFHRKSGASAERPSAIKACELAGHCTEERVTRKLHVYLSLGCLLVRLPEAKQLCLLPVCTAARSQSLQTQVEQDGNA